MTDVSFADFDPEDAWDAGDPIAERLALLVRIVQSIREERKRDAKRAEIRKGLALQLIAAVRVELDDLDDMLVGVDTLARAA